MSDAVAEDAAATMSRLRPDLILQRVPNVTLTLTAADTVTIKGGSGKVVCGRLGLQVLERFARPASVGEVAAEHSTGAQQWMDLMDTVALLLDHGILYDVSEGPADGQPRRSYWWDNPRPHIQMLDDVERTRRFIAAIEATVRPGDVVVDVGTGTGVLALAAARAGARHVYAVEAGAIAERAEHLVAANGFADRITVLRGWSTDVTLPEPADVLVTETLGTDPLDERILEIVSDARRRHLAPDARIIPSRISVYGTAVEVPDDVLAEHDFTRDQVERWQELYGFDFSPLYLDRREATNKLRFRTATTSSWLRLTPTVELVDLAVGAADSVSVSAEVTVPVERTGRLDGALLHFEAQLAPGVMLSTDPCLEGQVPSWWTELRRCPPREVPVGEEIQLTYGRKAGTLPNGLWVTVPS